MPLSTTACPASLAKLIVEELATRSAFSSGLASMQYKLTLQLPGCRLDEGDQQNCADQDADRARGIVAIALGLAQPAEVRTGCFAVLRDTFVRADHDVCPALAFHVACSFRERVDACGT